MNTEKIVLEIAKHIGQPLVAERPVSVQISKIANVIFAEAGEKVYTFEEDADADEILDVNFGAPSGDTLGCYITTAKRSPAGSVELTFKGLNSKLEYVCVDDVLNSPDTTKLARRRASIIRGMDKLELYFILNAILNSGDVQSVSQGSGEDIYDVIMKAKHALEDCGDNFLLLAAPNVKEAIDNYDKKNASALNYNVNLTAKLKELKIDVLKIFGKVKYNDSTKDPLLQSNSFILLALDSTIAEGKPITFVRRKINPEIAKLMGADVDTAQRALIVNPVPVQDNGNRLSYGVYGYESIIWAITNKYAVCKATDLSL